MQRKLRCRCFDADVAAVGVADILAGIGCGPLCVRSDGSEKEDHEGAEDSGSEGQSVRNHFVFLNQLSCGRSFGRARTRVPFGTLAPTISI